MENTAKTVVITDARKQLGWGRILILAFQHVFAFFGATVLVPMITGLPVQTALFFAGAGTLVFHVLTKFKVPAFLGSSFAFLGGYATIAANPTYANLSDLEKLALANGGVVIAGTSGLSITLSRIRLAFSSVSYIIISDIMFGNFVIMLSDVLESNWSLKVKGKKKKA